MLYDEKIIKEIKGFMDSQEGRRLYDVADKASKLGPCLEIGSYCGKSTIYIGSACRKNSGILFTIDHHRGSEEQQKGEEYFDSDLFDEKEGRVDTFRHFRKAMELSNLEDWVVPIVSKSEITAKAWATPLSLVFIDGGHSFETAFQDYTNFSQHIIPNGYLVIHDIFKNPEDGGQAPYDVYQYALKSGLFKELPMTKTVGVLKRL